LLIRIGFILMVGVKCMKGYLKFFSVMELELSY
jgi:hypothetical protein